MKRPSRISLRQEEKDFAKLTKLTKPKDTRSKKRGAATSIPQPVARTPRNSMADSNHELVDVNSGELLDRRRKPRVDSKPKAGK